MSDGARARHRECEKAGVAEEASPVAFMLRGSRLTFHGGFASKTYRSKPYLRGGCSRVLQGTPGYTRKTQTAGASGFGVGRPHATHGM
jgi:hypothetical protein